MKFKAPDKVSAVSLSTGHYTVVSGLIEVPEVSDADGDALKAFGFERYTAVQEGTFRRQGSDGGLEGAGGSSAGDKEHEPRTDETEESQKALDLDGDVTSTDWSSYVVENFKTKDEAVAFAQDRLDLSLDRRRSLSWMNKAIREAVAKRQQYNGAG